MNLTESTRALSHEYNCLHFLLHRSMEGTKYTISNFSVFSEDSNTLILKQSDSETLMSLTQRQNIQMTISLLLFDCCCSNALISFISYSTDVS